jgi:hypothetical protein
VEVIQIQFSCLIFFFNIFKDQLTFKSKRYQDESRIKFEFYINDLLEDRMIACCEHALINRNDKHLFEIQRVVGSKPCQQYFY